MDLFTEILNSYSKAHNRPLKLLEQEVDPRVAGASQVLATGNYQVSPQGMRTGSVPAADGGSVEVSIYNSGSIVVGGAHATFDGTTLSPGKNQQQFLKILTMLQGPLEEAPQEEEEVSEEEEQQQQMLQPGAAIFMSTLSEETKVTTSTHFAHIMGRAKAIWNSFSDVFKSKNSIDKFNNLLFGDATNSFKSQLVAAKTVFVLVDGEWVPTKQPPNNAQTSLISESFRDLIDTIADDTCNEEVLKDFAITAEGDVMISPKGDQEDRSQALAFLDKTGFLKVLINKASSKCEKEIKKRSKRLKKLNSYKSSTGGDNAIRGFAFEDILETVSLLRIISDLKKRGIDTSGLQKVVDGKLQLINTKLEKLKLNQEAWIKAYEESGLDPDQVSLMRDIGEILQGGPLTNNLYASMLRHSNQSVKVRGSIYALPVGDQTGSGQRQDVLEIFASPEDALEGAKRSGITDIEVVPMSVEEAFQGASKATLRALQKAGVFQRGQVIYGLKVSLKNYKSLHHAVLGSGRYSTFRDLATTPLGESKFSQTIVSNLGISEQDFSDFQSYASEMGAVGDAFRSVEFKDVDILTAKGDKINQNLAITFAENVLKDLSEKFGYPELQGSDLKHLKHLASQVAKASGTKEENEASFAKLQHRLTAFAEHKKLQKDIAAGGERAKKAKMYAAFKMMHAGGSDDDNLICDFRGLNTDENCVFQQNKPFRDAWRSIMANDGEWKLDITAGETTVGKKGSAGMGITVSRGREQIALSSDVVARKNEKGQSEGFGSNFSCKASKALLDKYNTVKNKFKKKKSIGDNTDLGRLFYGIKRLFEKAGIIRV